MGDGPDNRFSVAYHFVERQPLAAATGRWPGARPWGKSGLLGGNEESRETQSAGFSFGAAAGWDGGPPIVSRCLGRARGERGFPCPGAVPARRDDSRGQMPLCVGFAQRNGAT